MAQPKILFAIAGLHPESGGPSRSVYELCSALARAGTAVEILSLDYGETFSQPLTLPETPVKVTFVDCSSTLARRTQWTPRFRSVLHDRCRTAGIQIVHDTGLWLLTNHAAATVCREMNLPRIVSPRGMLTQWALRHKGLKKRVAWWLYQQGDLQTAQVLHATSGTEVRNFRAAGLQQPVAMIPNGVAPPPSANAGRPTPDTQRRTLLFLGRIHPVKGLLGLVEAWAAVRPANWRVIIGGGDERGHRAEVEAAIRARNLAGEFEFIGPVTSERRWEIYQSADLFVLPSQSENFGIVVAEALACGIPVITTRGAPWEKLVTHRCGWWVEIGPAGLAGALRDALKRPPGDLREMGQRGRKLVEVQYSWAGIAAQMKSVYEWMLDQGAKPDCVV